MHFWFAVLQSIIALYTYFFLFGILADTIIFFFTLYQIPVRDIIFYSLKLYFYWDNVA